MLAAVLVTVAFAQGPPPADSGTCPARLVALLDRPAAAFAAGREAASDAFGEPNLEAVEVLPRAPGGSQLKVRFRLFYDQARVTFAQAVAGGAEELEELDLSAPAEGLEPPVPFGASEPDLIERFGPPARTELPAPFERRLIYECERGRRPESVSFRFADGALTAVEWRLAPD